MNVRDLFVRRGDPVIPAVNRLTVAQRALRILPGRGILLSRSPAGVIISARSAVRGFSGAWAVALSGRQAAVSVGFVNGIEPVLDGRLLSGRDAKGNPLPEGPPSLKLSTDEFTIAGKSWIAIRAETDPETGRILAPKDQPPKLTLVQTKTLFSGEQDTVALHAIALLQRDGKDRQSLGTVHQIAYFDYQHGAARQAGRWRHFFSPA